jgi:hypothetical protein
MPHLSESLLPMNLGSDDLEKILATKNRFSYIFVLRVPNKATHGYDEGLIDSTDGDKITVTILESKEVSLVSQ